MTVKATILPPLEAWANSGGEYEWNEDGVQYLIGREEDGRGSYTGFYQAWANADISEIVARTRRVVDAYDALCNYAQSLGDAEEDVP